MYINSNNVHFDQQSNLNRTVDISTARNSEYTIKRLDICTPYWLVLRSATCASEASSEPVKLDIEDYKPFDLTFDLKEESTCASFSQTNSEQAIINIENEMKEAFLSSECKSLTSSTFTVSCFAGSSISCDKNSRSVVVFR